MGGGIRAKLLREVRFINGIINEDLIFGFRIFISASRVKCFDDVIFYRQRLDSISCAKTFYKHPNELLFRSYKINCDYLISLLNKSELASIHPLLNRCIANCAPMIFYCYSRDTSLIKREYLKKYFPYVNIRVKFTYYFPKTKMLLSKIKSIIK